jgi:hypothetical protein
MTTKLPIVPPDWKCPSDDEGNSEVSPYGVWTDYRIPASRSGWHPLCRTFYDYWLSISPPGGLPGRQHLSPLDIVSLLPRIWMLDVVRTPLRFRYRLIGTGETAAMGRELTGQWIDEAHPEFLTNRRISDRYRFMAHCGQPTWRRGPARWRRNRLHTTIENCIVPLAADGTNVDILFALSVAFFTDGTPVPI